MNSLYMSIIVIIGIVSSFAINNFLRNKYLEYSLNSKMINSSMLLSVIFSIVIGVKLFKNVQFCNSEIYIQVIYTIISGIMTGVLSSSFIIDILFKELPDENNVLIGLSIFLLSVSSLGCKVILSSIIMFIVFFIVSILTGQFGMGDVKMMFFMGLGFLPYKILDFLFTTFMLASIYSIFMIMFMKSTKKDTLPFGPFLIIGFLSVIL